MPQRRLTLFIAHAPQPQRIVVATRDKHRPVGRNIHRIHPRRMPGELHRPTRQLLDGGGGRDPGARGERTPRLEFEGGDRQLLRQAIPGRFHRWRGGRRRAGGSRFGGPGHGQRGGQRAEIGLRVGIAGVVLAVDMQRHIGSRFAKGGDAGGGILPLGIGMLRPSRFLGKAEQERFQVGQPGEELQPLVVGRTLVAEKLDRFERLKFGQLLVGPQRRGRGGQRIGVHPKCLEPHFQGLEPFKDFIGRSSPDQYVMEVGMLCQHGLTRFGHLVRATDKPGQFRELRQRRQGAIGFPVILVDA